MQSSLNVPDGYILGQLLLCFCFGATPNKDLSLLVAPLYSFRLATCSILYSMIPSFISLFSTYRDPIITIDALFFS